MPDLYGKLNKEVRIYNYEGVETGTAKVTVDNKTQDISVDVKRVPNELTLTTINGDTYTYDGSEPASFDIRTQVTDKIEEGNNLPVTSDAVKGYVDSKAEALEYVGGEGNFTNINGGVTVKGRLNVDDGIYSPVTSDDPNFVPNNKSVDDKITASEQKLIDERIGAFTRTEDKLFTDVTGSMTVKGHLNVDGGITSASAPTADSDVANKGYVDDNFVPKHIPAVTKSAYTTDTNGEQSLMAIHGGSAAPFSIAARSEGGVVRVGTPVGVDDAVNLKYADETYVAKIGTETQAGSILYGRTHTGDERGFVVGAMSHKGNTIVQRKADGTVEVDTPVADNDATTKKYVDDADAGKLNLTGGTITGSLAIQGDLTVTGTTTTEKAQTLAVKDSVIITNADGAELGATLSGIAIKKDGENTYGVMYDPSGDSVKLGLGTLDAENKFTFNESGTDGKPIATRADSSALTDGDLVKWDGTTNSLVDSGKNVDDFAPRIKNTEQNWKCYVERGKADGSSETSLMQATTGSFNGAIIIRDDTGSAKVKVPTANTSVEDIVNRGYVDDRFVAKTSTKGILYGTNSTDGNAKYFYWNESATPWSVPIRDGKGHVRTADPEGQNDAVNKKYAEANFVPIKPSNFDTTTEYDTEGAYCFAYNAKDKTFTPEYKDFGIGSNNLPIYNNDATLTVATPAMGGSEMLTGDAASDTYVYNNYVLSEFGHTPSQSAQDLLGQGFTKLAYVADFDPQENIPIALSETPNAGTIALRTSGGQVSTEEPTETYHATNKKYVDNLNTITITAGA